MSNVMRHGTSDGIRRAMAAIGLYEKGGIQSSS
jgi:hypothetical protein